MLWELVFSCQESLRPWASRKYLFCGLLNALNHCLCLAQVNIRQSICNKSWLSIRRSSFKIKQSRQAAGMRYVRSHGSYMPESKRKKCFSTMEMQFLPDAAYCPVKRGLLGCAGDSPGIDSEQMLRCGKADGAPQRNYLPRWGGQRWPAATWGWWEGWGLARAAMSLSSPSCGGRGCGGDNTVLVSGEWTRHLTKILIVPVLRDPAPRRAMCATVFLFLNCNL